MLNLSLVLWYFLRNRVNQIGIGNKETRKNNKQYIMRAIRAADLARLEHAREHAEGLA